MESYLILERMPSREVHKSVSKYFTGNSCNNTHRMIDYPVRYLGKRHQVLFHDPISAVIIGSFADGYEGAVSGLLHIGADYIKKLSSSKRK